MPCYEPKYKHSKGDAILCSIFKKAENEGKLDEVISALDYGLIGLSKSQIEAWWEDHKALDGAKLKERG